jgi:hypothetical protein
VTPTAIWIHRWLQESHPISKRRPPNPIMAITVPAAPNGYCSSCGIPILLHRPGEALAPPQTGFACGNSIERLPMLDVQWWLKRQRLRLMTSGLSSSPLDYRALKQCCRPDLASWSMSVAQEGNAAARRTENTETGHQVASLLGVLSEIYMRTLTRRAIGVLHEQRRYRLPEGTQLCLTPSHVHRALLKGAFQGGIYEAIFNTCASIGTSDRMIRAMSMSGSVKQM